ncbi:hypothetical protein HN011_010959 [Eciton burchellii]|nr:hypothetical protein HN011_010959 [Eciton burchellii]
MQNTRSTDEKPVKALEYTVSKPKVVASGESKTTPREYQNGYRWLFFVPIRIKPRRERANVVSDIAPRWRFRSSYELESNEPKDKRTKPISSCRVTRREERAARRQSSTWTTRVTTTRNHHDGDDDRRALGTAAGRCSSLDVSTSICGSRWPRTGLLSPISPNQKTGSVPPADWSATATVKTAIGQPCPSHPWLPFASTTSTRSLPCSLVGELRESRRRPPPPPPPSAGGRPELAPRSSRCPSVLSAPPSQRAGPRRSTLESDPRTEDSWCASRSDTSSLDYMSFSYVDLGSSFVRRIHLSLSLFSVCIVQTSRYEFEFLLTEETEETNRASTVRNQDVRNESASRCVRVDQFFRRRAPNLSSGVSCKRLCRQSLIAILAIVGLMVSASLRWLRPRIHC